MTACDQRVLGLEMVVDGGEVDAGFGGDGAERGGLEAVAGEEALGGIKDTILGSSYVCFNYTYELEHVNGLPGSPCHYADNVFGRFGATPWIFS